MEVAYFLAGGLTFLGGLYFGWNMGRNETFIAPRGSFYIEKNSGK